MTKKELLEAFEEVKDLDTENRHVALDDLLLAYINDPEISIAYDSYHKWYA